MTVSTTPPRVRFAPSPTGYLHVGGARTALFNWLFARRSGGAFLLRIEDTDRERSRPEMTAAILDGLQWLGLAWDEGPYHQADALVEHRAAAERLVREGRAYRCFCPPTAPSAKAEPCRCGAIDPATAEQRAAVEAAAIRFRVPAGTTAWDDLVHGPLSFRNEDIGDFVILRSDGTPVYNFAVVVDDARMRITHVLRGDDHISNTPKQILLYEALGFAVPLFGHLPMILGPDGRRLSKRHGATSVAEYRRQGLLPEAMVNFLALLGWSPGDDREVLTREELVARFDLARVHRKAAIFDPAKLLWLNAQHMARLTGLELVERLRSYRAERGEASLDLDADPTAAGRVAEVLKTRVRTLAELSDHLRTYLAGPTAYDPAGVAKHWNDPVTVAARLEDVAQTLAAHQPWTPEAIERRLRELAAARDVPFGALVHPTRLALTGATVSPPIHDLLWALGRERVVERLRRAAERLRTEAKVAS